MAAYFLGAIPFAFLVVRYTRGQDIRNIGSGNVGATNALRAAGKGWGLATLLLDAGKGYAAVVLAKALTHSDTWAIVAVVAAILGHMFSVFLGFRGGKGVATGCGAYLAVTPGIVAGAAAVFVVAVGLWRYASLGSILAAASFPVFAILRGEDRQVILAGFACAGLIIWRHSANIQRILRGTENRLVSAKK